MGQDMLFASFSNPVIGDEVAATEARLCALNIQNPNQHRAQRLTDWLISRQVNVIVLTELCRNDGGQRILASLQADGFTVTCPPTQDLRQYTTAIATKGFTHAAVVEPAPDPRLAAVDLTSPGGRIRLAGVYGPSNGLTSESSTKRIGLQQLILGYLKTIAEPGLCIVGDLNTIEPGHQPPLPAYLEHDLAFYTGMLDLGTTDAYRERQPDGNDHSWLSDRYGNQRIDHLFIGADLVANLSDCRYDHTPRTEQLTDHAALLATLRW